MEKRADYNKIFRKFHITELEKTERVLSALKDYFNHTNYSPVGLGYYEYEIIEIEELKCTSEEVYASIPVLQEIKKEPLLSVNKNYKPRRGYPKASSIFRIRLIEKIEVIEKNCLVGVTEKFSIDESLKNIQEFIQKNKISKPAKKITLELSDKGLRNTLNGKLYGVTGKRKKYIEILHKNGAMSGKKLKVAMDQEGTNLSTGISDFNNIAIRKLELLEEVISSNGKNRYFLNNSFKIKILL